MPLRIPSIADPREPAKPALNVYGWVSMLSLDLGQGSGSLVVTVNTDASTWQAQPIKQLRVSLGQDFPDGSKAPTLADLMADAEFATAYQTIAAKIDAAVAECHPELKGATPL